MGQLNTTQRTRILAQFRFSLLLLLLLWVVPQGVVEAQPASAVSISGETRVWHNITLTFDGPEVSEESWPNPFKDYRLNVTFTNGGKSYTVPGYFAADGNAAETSSTRGNKWRVHFVPDAPGTWQYRASFRTGSYISVSMDANAGTPTSFDGASGSFNVEPSNKSGSDFRAHGFLRHVGGHYFQFAGSGQYYIKAGADSPENFLAYADFDGTYDIGGVMHGFLHRYTPHIGDWRSGDPTWQGGKGRGIIGALNYLASKGMNSVYFLTYNIDHGDGQDTWPWIHHNSRDRYDVSKLAQWEIVFSHMDRLGLQLHIVLQELENNNALGGSGELNNTRRLYYRELVARFGHHLAIQWNLGEENQNTDGQRIAMARYIRELDPYDHPINYHTWYDAASVYYNGTMGQPYFESTSIQGKASRYNEWAVELRRRSAAAGRPWAIYGDEQGPAVAPNLSNIDQLRRDALWGNLMGGGAGVEWYFGYQGDFGDLQSEDWRRADGLWTQTKHAIDFFHANLPFWEMTPSNGLVQGMPNWVYAKAGEVYAVYLPWGTNESNVRLDLNGKSGTFSVQWYNPRSGGGLQNGTVSSVNGNGWASLGRPPADINRDWVVLVNRTGQQENPPTQAPTELPPTAAPTATPSPTYAPSTPPEINDVSDQTLIAGENKQISITVTDADNDPITMSALGIPLFATFTDHGNNTATLTLSPLAQHIGVYSVIVFATDGRGGNDSETIQVTVNQETSDQSVTSFTLINADTDQPIPGFETLADGTTLNLATLPTRNISLRANTNPSNVGSVVFSWNELTHFLDDDMTPYAMNGDLPAGNYRPWPVSPGIHTVKATPYTQLGGQGTAGTSLGITLMIVDQMPPTPTPTPLPPTQPPETQAVVSFTLINADTDQPISGFDPLVDGATLNLATLPTRNLSVRANTNPGTVGSVEFGLNNRQRFLDDDMAPYALNGDIPAGDYRSWTPALGVNILTATPYSQAGLKGEQGTALTITFLVVDQPPTTPTAVPPTATPAPDTLAVVSFTLINADTDQPVSGFETLTDGATLNLADLPTRNLNIVANTNPATVGSVNFSFNNNPFFRMENSPPYTFAGGASPTDFLPWTPPVGSHVLTAMPYSETNLGGAAGTPLTIHFTVVDQDIVMPTPIPVTPPARDNNPITFTLINADTDQPVPGFEAMQSGAVLNLANMPTRNLTIRANVNLPNVGSVQFYLDSSTYAVENVAPYSLDGDRNGDYNAWKWAYNMGVHQLDVYAFSDRNGKGQVLGSRSITFTINP